MPRAKISRGASVLCIAVLCSCQRAAADIDTYHPNLKYGINDVAPDYTAGVFTLQGSTAAALVSSSDAHFYGLGPKYDGTTDTTGVGQIGTTGSYYHITIGSPTDNPPIKIANLNLGTDGKTQRDGPLPMGIDKYTPIPTPTTNGNAFEQNTFGMESAGHDGQAYGEVVFFDHGTLTNYAVLDTSGTNTGAEDKSHIPPGYPTGSAGHGICQDTGGSTVVFSPRTNANGTQSSVYNYGTIKGHFRKVSFGNDYCGISLGLGLVYNYRGTVSGYNAIYLGSGGMIVNEAAGAIQGWNDGAAISGYNGTIVNAGAINNLPNYGHDSTTPPANDPGNLGAGGFYGVVFYGPYSYFVNTGNVFGGGVGGLHVNSGSFINSTAGSIIGDGNRSIEVQLGTTTINLQNTLVKSRTAGQPAIEIESGINDAVILRGAINNSTALTNLPDVQGTILVTPPPNTDNTGNVLVFKVNGLVQSQITAFNQAIATSNAGTSGAGSYTLKTTAATPVTLRTYQWSGFVYTAGANSGVYLTTDDTQYVSGATSSGTIGSTPNSAAGGISSDVDLSGVTGGSFNPTAVTNSGGHYNLFLGSNQLILGRATDAATAAVAVDGDIQDGGVSGTIGGSLLKNGAGTAYLTGRNSYTGGTKVAGGTLFIGDGTQAGSVEGKIAVDAGATLGFALPSGNTLVESNRITGAGAVVLTGAGVLRLGGENSYTGTTLVQKGTLSLRGSEALAGSTLDTSGAGSITFGISYPVTYDVGGLKGTGKLAIGANTLNLGGNTFSTTYAGICSGTGTINKVGPGTLTFTGANTYSGGTEVAGGALVLGGNASAGPGDILVDAGATLTLSGTLTSGTMPAVPGQMDGGGQAGTTLNLAFDGLTASQAIAAQTALDQAGAGPGSITLINGTTGKSYTYKWTGFSSANLVGNYAPLHYTVSASVGTGGGGTVSGGGSYSPGGSVTVVATPNASYNFAGWTLGGRLVSTAASYTFAVHANSALVANFQPNMFAAWEMSHFTPAQIAVPSISGKTANPSGDGVVNLLKYAFGADPLVSDVSVLPDVAVVNGHLTLTYLRNQWAKDLTYTVEVSGDLKTWTSGAGATSTPVMIGDGLNAQTFQAHDLVLTSAVARRFIRLRVTGP